MVRNYLEKKQMGELIAFKPARRCAPFRAAPVDAGTVVIFTGVRQERLESFESVTVKASEARRAPRMLTCLARLVHSRQRAAGTKDKPTVSAIISDVFMAKLVCCSPPSLPSPPS